MKLFNRTRILMALCLTAACLAATAARAGEKSQKELLAQAKITKAEAKKIALAKVPNGKVKEAELEEEKGKLIWSFDIKTKGSKDITEVNIDAITGDVVGVEHETPEQQKNEKD